MMSFRGLTRLSVIAVSAAPFAVMIACGGDKPADPKTAQNATATPTATQTAAPIKPPTPENLPNKGDTAGVRISDEIRQKCGITDSEAYFAFDSAVVKTSYMGPLDKVAICFTTGPLAGRQVRLVGHADPRGPKDYNMRLGHERADAVKDYLKAKMDEKKVETTSRGDEDAEGKDEIGYAKDRRVDVMLGQ